MSIPFSSGNSFLRIQHVRTDEQCHVSIPFTSGNSFLPRKNHGNITPRMCVNPLHVGELISTSLEGGARMSLESCVNPLHVGELISTQLRSSRSTPSKPVSIPFTSGNSFLQEYGQCYYRDPFVSIPFTSGNSFLLARLKMAVCKAKVSIPFTSGNSFLHVTHNAQFIAGMCQSPSRRGTHFYKRGGVGPEKLVGCVNPLHVGELISTGERNICYFYSYQVSIPFTSGNSFLPVKCYAAVYWNSVSIPFTSGNSFLLQNIKIFL